MTFKDRPVLGVIACNRTVESQAAQAVMTRYLVSAIKYADAAALLVPAMPELMHAKEVAPRLDGILLTGTPSNLDPKRYGVIVDDAPGPFDPARDEMTAHLIEAMLELGKPVFGICRGFQELNVAFGGTLRRDMAEVVEQSEVLVIANGSKPYREVGGMLKPGQVLVDLVHAVDPKSVVHGEYHGLAW